MREARPALAVGGVAVLCCAALPVLAGVLGGLGLALWLGLGVGLAAVGVAAVIVFLRRRPTASAADPGVER